MILLFDILKFIVDDRSDRKKKIRANELKKRISMQRKKLKEINPVVRMVEGSPVERSR